MFLSALILPFTLFIKKLTLKYWYVLIVVFGMKSGFYFERFVIMSTSYHHNYLTENRRPEIMNSFTLGIAMLFLQGIIITILALGIFEIIKQKSVRNTLK